MSAPDPAPRIAPVAPGTRPELADLEARILAERGRISPLYQVLLNSPSLATGWEQMLTAVRKRNSLAPALRELVILRVAVLNRASYEFDAHVPYARDAGLTDATIDALREGRDASDPGFSPVQQAVLAYTDAMTREIQVPDALFERVRVHFNDPQLLDLTGTVAAYNMVSRLLVALRIGH